MQCILVLIEILISVVNHIFFQNSISFLLSKWPSSWVSKCFCQRATFKGAARGGAEGAQAPPLAIRILMFIS